jgi:penicillin V acylase-like amidase (Ntn superfamily)
MNALVGLLLKYTRGSSIVVRLAQNITDLWPRVLYNARLAGEREENIKATAPVKLPSKHCPTVRFIRAVSIIKTQRWYLKDDSTQAKA